MTRDAAPRGPTEEMAALLSALKKSGFPLQARVEHEIVARYPRWRLLASEYPWRDPDGRDQFADVVAVRDTLVPVVECKKAAERSLLFLRPLSLEHTGETTDFALWHVEHPAVAGQRYGNRIMNVPLLPRTYRASICVPREQSGQRLLEHEARPIILAADAVAEGFPRDKLPGRSFIIPVLVTTASLFTLRFKPTDVSLDTGELAGADPTKMDMDAIPWVRFEKTFTAAPGSQTRTVFIVSAAALPEFLDALAPTG